MARRLRSVAAAAGAVLALAACGSTSSSSGSGPTVTARNYSFTPSTVAVSAGQQVTVTFVNAGTTAHSLTLDNGGGDVTAQPGETQTLTFTAPQSGTVTFHCKFHPTQMTGSFTVGGSGAGGAASPSPSDSMGSVPGY
ncbi:MAG TPA: cupredoxin domain-containing protein [Candidatus Dormibacteraeota bacterium]|nr:cupredoxin domain-containing protein [Candidatus Dormibacteraeota bacterium]